MIFEPGLIRRIESSAARLMMAVAAGALEGDAAVRVRAEAFGDGALASFGPGRYVNRAVGVSLMDLDDRDLDRLESFFDDAGVAPSLEVSSWAPAALLARLAARRYTVAWFRNVYVAALEDRPVVAHPAMSVEEVREATVETWLSVLRAGHDLTTPEAVAVGDEWALAARRVPGTTDYLAYLDGIAAGCGSVTREAGIGWIGGATTRPSFRRRGVQGALVRQRMAAAYESGCDLAVVTAIPSGDSARNVARLGFTLAYCQAVMTKLPS